MLACSAARRRSLRRAECRAEPREKQGARSSSETSLQSQSARSGTGGIQMGSQGLCGPRKTGVCPMCETAPGAASSTALGAAKLLRRSGRGRLRGGPDGEPRIGRKRRRLGWVSRQSAAALPRTDADREAIAGGERPQPRRPARVQQSSSGSDEELEAQANRQHNGPRAVSATASQEDLPMQAVRKTASRSAQGRSAPCAGSVRIVRTRSPGAPRRPLLGQVAWRLETLRSVQALL